MPTVPRTAIGVIFFILGSLLCSVVGDADLCRALRHVGTDLLVTTPDHSGPSNPVEQSTE